MKSIVVAFTVALFAVPVQSAEKPNVLFIAVDDLNDWLGCLKGHPQAHTPNIDRLAARGILFTNAHCAAPACNPSRAAVFSGLMPKRTGVWSNNSPRILKQQPKAKLLPMAFADAGYRTLGTGKLLHGGSRDHKSFQQYHGVQQRWSPLTKKSVQYTKAELPSKSTNNPRHVVKHKSGRTFVLPLNRMPSDRKPNQPAGESFDWGPFDVPDSEFGDTQITDWAIDKLKRGFDKPFFLGVGYYRPHIPLWAPKRFFERFKQAPAKLPPIRSNDLKDLSTTGRKWALEAVTAGSHATVVKHRQWRQAVEAYLACVTYVDEEIGRLLKALDDSKSADNTVIVLWSDHGWHLGEKQHWGKWTGWERSTRVPLIIVPPKNQASQFAKPGSRCDQPVSLVDLYPTLAELCGVKTPDRLSGTSLVPLLRDPAKKTGRRVVTQFDRGNATVRSNSWRYIRYRDGSEELYDHRNDPHEYRNVAEIAANAKVKASLAAVVAPKKSRAAFESQFKSTPDRVWVGSDYWANPMEDWSIADGQLTCRGGGNRNLALLTRTLTGKAGFWMSVQLGRAKAGAGSAGFRIGIRDEIKDYRAAALRGRGLDVGINTRTGRLFIGETAGGKRLKDEALKDVTLALVGTLKDGKVELTLSATDSAGKALAVLKSTVDADKVRGLVALVNNHQTTGRAAYWFSAWKLSGDGVQKHNKRAWGPILWTMHTLHHTHTKDGAVLKLTAQLVPMGAKGPKLVRLSFGKSKRVFLGTFDPLACNATFRVRRWNTKTSDTYTVQYGNAKYTGTIRAEPAGKPLVVAGFTGNQDYVFPNNAVVRNVRVQNPDVLFFSGDQIYEAVGGYGIVRAPTDTADRAGIRRATLNYLRKWYLLGWAFGDLMRDRPTICLPDDHDVYQGNVWGEGGLNPHGIRNHAKGGFAEHPTFVNTVIRTQCSHHPDLPDARPMKQGINVFYGPMLYGRVSFAIIEDRYFKSGPEGKVNTWKGRPDHLKDSKYDVSKLDKPGLELLGKRQEKFLRQWIGNWRGADFKCVLSQTIFCNLANYHGPRRQFIFADLDSNGWPQTPRNNTLRILRKGYAFHYAGDQHLPSITRNGIDTWGDAGFAFCVPSIAAGYPRSWLPDQEGRPVRNRPAPKLANTGDYRDGFGNHISVYAIANPAKKNRRGRENRAHDKSSGHAIVRFDPKKLTISMECYRVQIDPKNPKKGDQFPGWPKTIHLKDNRGQKIVGYLPEVTAPKGLERPILKVSDAKTGELIYALRLNKRRIKPWVFKQGSYRVDLGSPSQGKWTTQRNAKANIGR